LACRKNSVSKNLGKLRKIVEPIPHFYFIFLKIPQKSGKKFMVLKLLCKEREITLQKTPE